MVMLEKEKVVIPKNEAKKKGVDKASRVDLNEATKGDDKIRLTLNSVKFST